MKLDTEKIDSFTKILLEGNKIHSSNIIKQHISENISFIDIYENLIKPALYKIGQLWEYNKISVASEHLATEIAGNLINEILPYILSSPKNNKTIVLACVEGEEHKIGLKMVSDVFEKHGWHSLYIGSNTPRTELINFIEQIKPDMIGLSMSMYINISSLEVTLKMITRNFPAIPTIIGGQGLIYNGHEIAARHGTYYIKNLNEIDSFLQLTIQNVITGELHG